MIITPETERALRIALARKDFYEYCKVTLPQVYLPDRIFLMDLCNRLQNFIEDPGAEVMVVNMPPRFCKSLTAGCLSQWIFGRDPLYRIMTGSYNEKLAMKFARMVRNAIMIPPGQSRAKIHFSDIFPGVAVKRTESAVDMWALEGSPETSYLATSPTGTATGVGANLFILDDIIKNPIEAYSDNVLDSHWEWLNNNIMQRLEGNWKILIVMTRWATRDIAGRMLDDRADCQHITYKAFTEGKNGKKIWLCPSILDEKKFKSKTKSMNEDIVLANFQQEPIDVKGRLYRDTFKTYRYGDLQVQSTDVVFAVADTADTGKDFLCSIVYIVRDGVPYVIDVVYDDAAMEYTELEVARQYDKHRVAQACIESNNGGRGFERNVRRLQQNKMTYFLPNVTTANKDARILESAGWIQNTLVFPEDWKSRWPKFANEVLTYNSKGKNEHDDACDTLARLYEQVAGSFYVTQEDYK